MIPKRNIKIIFSEFWTKNRPNYDNVRQHFPEADIELWTEENMPIPDWIDQKHPRAGWRMHDYNQIDRLFKSKADITIALDSDMLIVSDAVKSIIPLTERFGVCLPCNPRLLVRRDTLIGTDSDQRLDDTQGYGYAFNSAIMTKSKADASNKFYFYACLNMEQNPGRLPLALYRAAFHTGFFPCLLPPQWCVCESQEGCGDEIILHVGHEKVRKFYEKK